MVKDNKALTSQLGSWLNARPADTDPAWLQWAETELAEFWQYAEHHEFKAPDSTRMCYCVWPQPATSPWVIISPGRVEAYVKYQEVALEWAAKGFSVAIIDHRGQGYSDRLTARHDQGHVAHFTDFVNDFAQFMDILAPRISGQATYLLAHSMGGAIAALYLAQHGQRKPPYPFTAAVLNAPMMGIHTGPWPASVSTVIVRAGAWLNRTFAPNKPGYFIGMADYCNVAFSDNDLTHSEARYAFFTAMYQADPRIRVGGPTWQWLNESLRAMALLPKIASRINIPVLILQAENDQIVTPKAQVVFAGRLAHKQSKLVTVISSEHEILMETDDIRQPAIAVIEEFLGDL